MWDYLNSLMTLRAMLVPGVCVVVGIVLHVRGAKIGDPDKAAMQQQVAALFDALSVITSVSAARHAADRSKIAQTAAKVNETVTAVNKTTDVLNPATPAGPGALPQPIAPLELKKSPS